jgi:uncharacterized protein YukE
MNQIVADPDKIRGFAHALRSYMTFTNQALNTVHVQLSRLGDTWRDQEYRRFADEFRATQAQLSELAIVLDSVVPRLLRDAEQAEQIHRIPR